MTYPTYQSNKQKKIWQRQVEREAFLEERRIKEVTERWEQAQVTAAGWQSVLDHAVNIYQEHKDELEEEVVKNTEEQIAERQLQIKDFLMSEKEAYLEAMGIQAD